MLEKPSHIRPLALDSAAVTFKADPLTLDLLFDKEVPLVDDWMDVVTERAKVGTGAALAEWIAWRFEGSETGEDLLNFSQSLYAAAIDFRYAIDIDAPIPKNGTPVDRIAAATKQEGTALFRKSRELLGASSCCVNLCLIVRHVLPKPHQAAFKGWLTTVLNKRIGKAYEFDEDVKDKIIKLGEPVPRAAFDLEIPFDPRVSQKSVDAFIATLDPSANRYLRSAADMKKLGFKGEPYP